MTNHALELTEIAQPAPLPTPLPLQSHELTALPAPTLDRAYLPYEIEAASVVLRFMDGSRMMIPAADLLDPKAMLRFMDQSVPLAGLGFQKAAVADEIAIAVVQIVPAETSQAARFFDVFAENALMSQTPDLQPENHVSSIGESDADPIRIDLLAPIEVVGNPESVRAAITDTIVWLPPQPTVSLPNEIKHIAQPFSAQEVHTAAASQPCEHPLYADEPRHVLGNGFGKFAGRRFGIA